MTNWNNFKHGLWETQINVKDFIVLNYQEYLGNEDFLESISDKTKVLLKKVNEYEELEKQNNGVYKADTAIASSILSHNPGYIDYENEVIVGLQTDEPLKRPLHPCGGIKCSEESLEAYGLEISPEIKKIFSAYRKTHNQGVFDCYTDEMRLARHNKVITGLPDSYARGRIIGDYRLVALYGVDTIIDKKKLFLSEHLGEMNPEKIQEREEIRMQISSLFSLKRLALMYGYNVSNPASSAKEAIQYIYFAYLAAIKEQNGAAMSLGRVSTFIDIYIERDIKRGILNEKLAQELIDQFVLKLRIVRFMRTPEYNELFSGDPTWITESIAGMSSNHHSLVTKTSFRFLRTLINLNTAPEPNLTILWSRELPNNFKEYCAKISILTSSIQYINDSLLVNEMGDDYGIACCVSPMRIGKDMQFFGARANLAKALLYAINGGVDEITYQQVTPKFEPIRGKYLEFDEVLDRYDQVLDWLCGVYVNSLNIIHYMHDKYCYESLEMSLHDNEVRRFFATGIAGLSCVIDSLSAIKFAKVEVIRDELGISKKFIVHGEFPRYGNNNDDVDQLGVFIVKKFIKKIRTHYTYRNSIPTTSILTITSNVVYGKNTGATPDGRDKGVPFAPGANPMNGKDISGALASLESVAKIPYEYAKDGISNTFSVVPTMLGKELKTQAKNLVGLIDGYALSNGYHLNVNVLNVETLEDALKNHEKYPNLTIRVSGYAVKFNKLTLEQKKDVISRTIHKKM